ncbi:MAG: peptidase M1 [Terriglobia bacterium]|nr:MAG: peptidase M1 [Terriglobia bacterium]
MLRAGFGMFVDVITGFALFLTAAAAAAARAPEQGISEALASERHNNIRALRYDLTFRIPQNKTEHVQGNAVIQFQLRVPSAIVLDFDQPRDHVRSVRAGERSLDFEMTAGHLVIPASAVRAGENRIAIGFTAGDEALNRNDEFLYTLFVPARAHRAFPCFDQPDLKARYTLSLEIPAAWQAVANGAETGPAEALSSERRWIHFAETPPLSTYLFGFAAGRFHVVRAERNGRTFRMFHRETDAGKVARNQEAIFDLHARALAWLEEYTGIPYPWGKFDFVLLPAFQFGGMEHAGAILYNASGLLLDPSATQNQVLQRASTIAHETAHMWFGDLVTMRWFNDVWMKETLANFMAAKIVNPSFPEINHNLRFLLAYHPAAYDVDRTAGTNAIRQELGNLEEAGSLYGAIIYQKAPIAMRQLEGMLGQDSFREGMREYLRRYQFGNATWLDLVRILNSSGHNVTAWSRAWIETRGRPEVKVSGATLAERDPLARGVFWPERLKIAIGEAGGVEHRMLDLQRPTMHLASPAKPPQYLIPNSDGLGYGLFLLDENTRRYLLDHMEEIADPLLRGSAWVDLWENFLEGNIAPTALLDLILRAGPKETDEQIVQRGLGDLPPVFWRYLPAEQRSARAAAIERMLRQGVREAGTPSAKSAYFTAFRNVALTPDGLAWLERIWRREEKIEGLPFAEEDEIAMALELAVRAVPGWEDILRTQRDRTLNPDRRARFEFVMPALSADPAVRAQAFARLRSVENRRHEPWVLESLRYLHHPLRQESARAFLRPSLELLPEIRRTGDIFFPQRWMDASLGGHNSREAAAIVRDFLARNPQLPQRLRWVVLSAADDLFRASR